MSEKLGWIRISRIDLLEHCSELSDSEYDLFVREFVRDLKTANVNSGIPFLREEIARATEKIESLRKWSLSQHEKRKNGTGTNENREEEQQRESRDVFANENSLESQFEKARKHFPGRKMGFDVEFAKFLKKCGGRKQALIEVPKLITGIDDEIDDRNKKKAVGAFYPEWKHFGTWINAKAWEQEFEPTVAGEKPKANSYQDAKEESYRQGEAAIQRFLDGELQ